MGTANEPAASGRLALIESVISAELARQAQAGAMRVDVPALARVIDTAMSATEPDALAGEGKRPDELNATNDD